MSKDLKSPALKTMLGKVGNTPIDEPEIHTLLQDNKAMAIFEIPKFVIERAKKDIEDFDSDDLALFYHFVMNKVVNVKYDSGSYKSTEKTKELENISFENRVRLFDMSQETSNIDVDNEDEMDAHVKKQQAFIWKAVNIGKKGLTDWEINLVEAICMDQALKMAQTALDVDLGN